MNNLHSAMKRGYIRKAAGIPRGLDAARQKIAQRAMGFRRGNPDTPTLQQLRNRLAREIKETRTRVRTFRQQGQPGLNARLDAEHSPMSMDYWTGYNSIENSAPSLAGYRAQMSRTRATVKRKARKAARDAALSAKMGW